MNRNTSSSRGKSLSALKRLWKNDYFKTAVAIVLIVAIVLRLLIWLAVRASHV